jgi:hypothetical protein
MLSQLNPLHIPPANLPKIHSDPFLPSTPRSSEWSFSFGLSHQNLVHFSVLSHACHMPRPPQCPWLDQPNDIWRWVQNMNLLIVKLPPFACKVFSLEPYSQTPSMFFSLNLKDQVSHPYRQLAETFTLLDSRREGKVSEPNGRKNSTNLVCS